MLFGGGGGGRGVDEPKERPERGPAGDLFIECHGKWTIRRLHPSPQIERDEGAGLIILSYSWFVLILV
jgi:hypothetical protein